MKREAMAALVAVALLAPCRAGAATSKLRLYPGFYVVADLPCGQMYQAAMIQFTGTAFQEGPRLCHIVSVTHRGSIYRIAQHCQDQQSGTWPRAGLDRDPGPVHLHE